MAAALNMAAPMHASTLTGMRAASRSQTAGAFPAFYDEHYSQLVVAFQSALGDRRLAEDTAQEAMLRACQRWAKVGAYDNPAGWCYRVGMNWATSRWRKRRREVMTDEPRSINEVSAQDRLPDDELLRAIHALPSDQRQIIVLRIWLDWSVRETSEALEIPEGTVRSRQNRALKKLKAELEGSENYAGRGGVTLDTDGSSPAQTEAIETEAPDIDLATSDEQEKEMGR